MTDDELEFWGAELDAAYSLGKCRRCKLPINCGNFYAAMNPPPPAPELCVCLANAEAALVKERASKSPPWLEELCHAFGWQGGTWTQAIAEVRGLTARATKAEAERDEARKEMEERREKANAMSAVRRAREVERDEELATERSLRVEAERERDALACRIQTTDMPNRARAESAEAALAVERAKHATKETHGALTCAEYTDMTLTTQRELRARAARAERACEAAKEIRRVLTMFLGQWTRVESEIVDRFDSRLAEWEAGNGSENPVAAAEHVSFCKCCGTQRGHEHLPTCTTRAGESSGGKP